MDLSRISLRSFKLSDVDDFLKWASDGRVTRYLRWNTITSREEALTYLEKVAIPHPCRRSICLEDRSIGYVSIKPETGDESCRAQVGYAVATEYWGQGIATIALKLALSSVFEEFPDLVRVEALVEVENKGSQAVLQKVGFLKEGMLRLYGYCKGEIRDKFVHSFCQQTRFCKLKIWPYGSFFMPLLGLLSSKYEKLLQEQAAQFDVEVVVIFKFLICVNGTQLKIGRAS